MASPKPTMVDIEMANTGHSPNGGGLVIKSSLGLMLVLLLSAYPIWAFIRTHPPGDVSGSALSSTQVRVAWVDTNDG